MFVWNSVCNSVWEVCNQICTLELGEVGVTDLNSLEVMTVVADTVADADFNCIGIDV